jgi:hypothetical protein
VLSEEKAARLATDQSLQASDVAKAALAQDLQSVQASLTATMKKLISKSSALDFVVIREREAEIMLQVVEEKIKA